MTDKHSTYIIIPTYNEADNIVLLLRAITALDVPNVHVLVIDDNSPDGTADAVIAENLAQVDVVQRSGKLGIGSAYILGFGIALAAGADRIIQMDADFSHKPADIVRLLAAMEEDVGLVIGSRRVDGGNIVGWGPVRTMMSWGAMQFARLLLGLKTKDVTAGFRCFDRIVLDQIDLARISSDGYAFQEEMLYRTEQLGVRVVEVPVVFEDRERGQSKLSRKDIVEFFIVMVRLRFGK